MSRAVALRVDFDGSDLRRLAKATKDAGQSRRLLALAEIYDGGRRTDAARVGDVGLQVVRDWVLRFKAKGQASQRYGPSDRSAAQGDLRHEASAQPVTQTKLLVSYRTYRQLSVWIPPPLVFRAFGVHCHVRTFNIGQYRLHLMSRCHAELSSQDRPPIQPP